MRREGPEPSINAASILRVGHLPAPTLGTIPDIEKVLKSLARAPNFKEHISDYIQEEVRFLRKYLTGRLIHSTGLRQGAH